MCNVISGTSFLIRSKKAEGGDSFVARWFCTILRKIKEGKSRSYQSAKRKRKQRKSSCLAGKTPGFPSKIRLPSTTNTIPVSTPRYLPSFQPCSKQYHNTSHALADIRCGGRCYLLPSSFSFFVVSFCGQFSTDEGGRLPLLAAVYLSAPLSLADLVGAITFAAERSKVTYEQIPKYQISRYRSIRSELL